jgi:Tol biopolymer transport system component
VAALGIWFLRPRSHSAPKIVPLTGYPGNQITPAFSPDGKQVAFAWDGEDGDNLDIYVKLVDAGTPLRLTNNAATEYSPAWSPDGRYIAFCRDRGERSEVWMIPALGGPERKLGESAGMYSGPEFSVFDRVRPTALSWSPDGKFLALSYRSSSGAPLGIYIMSAETGEKRRLTSPPKEYGGDLGPRFSPNGETLAFVRAPSHLSRAIYLLSMSGSGAARGEPRRLIPDQGWIGGFDWTPDGRNIVFSAGQFGSTNLWTIAASGGTPERLVGGENSTELSISRTGSRLVYVRSSLDYNIWRISGPNALDKGSVPTRFIASTQPDGSPQFSPDGEKIVFASARSGTYAIWVCDRDGLNPVELASDGTTVGSPRWSPDSHWIAFDSPKTGNEDIYVISAEGGPVRRLTAGPSNNIRPSWSKDGRWIYFGSNRNGDWQIWKAPAQGGTALQVTKKGAAEAFESFDGKFVYYAKDPGIWEVPVGGGEETQVLDQGSQNLWALTNQGIYFGVINSSVAPLLKFYRFATSQVEIFREFSKDTRLDSLSTAFSVSPDGQWILYTQIDQAGSDLMLMENYR